MTERSSDRWVSLVLSVLLHGALLGAVGFGWWTFKHPEPPKPTLAIEATLVDSRSVRGAATPAREQPAPQPPQPVPQPETPAQVESDGPPEPSAEELARRALALRDQQVQAAQALQKEQERKALEEQTRKAQQAEAQRQEEARRRQEAKQQEEESRQAQQRAEAQRQATEAEEARKHAEEKRLAEHKKLADERRAVQEAERTRIEADLKRSLDAEEHLNAVRSSGALASWQAQITARIQRAWLRPPSARAGIECVLDVTQVPGGEVTNVRLGACNGDQAVRDSIVAAAYRASPLPPPPDPSLFERNLEITFKPD